jgi:hypothetical protein
MIYNGIEYSISEKYSNKVWPNRDLTSCVDMKGCVIYASSFYNEKPNSTVLPSDLSGTTFIKCQLNNVIVPNGVTLIDCDTRKFQVQNDGFDWWLDNDGNPMERIG